MIAIGSLTDSAHLTLGLSAKCFSPLAADSASCSAKAAARAESLSLLFFGQQQEPSWCSASPPLDRLSIPDRLQLTEGRHLDADVDLSLTAPEVESKGYEVPATGICRS